MAGIIIVPLTKGFHPSPSPLLQGDPGSAGAPGLPGFNGTDGEPVSGPAHVGRVVVCLEWCK